MHVLLLGPFPPPHGGVEIHLVALRRFLVERGARCSVINLTRHRRIDAGGVYYPATAEGVLEHIFALRADVLHLHFGGTLTPRLLALSLAAALVPGARTVLTFHSGGFPSSPEGRAARPGSVAGRILRRLDRLIAVNHDLADVFRRFGARPERVRVISPFTFATAPGADPLPEALRAFFRERRPLLVTVSGLEPEYDLETQMDALGRILTEHPEAGLAIIGSGSQAAALAASVARRPYAARILLCGDQPHAVTLGAVAQAAVFLRTTLYDGDAISVREAIALGVPVIATDNGMRPAGVRLVAVADAAALAAAIRRTLAEDERRRSATTPAAEATANLESVLELYGELLEEE